MPRGTRVLAWVVAVLAVGAASFFGARAAVLRLAGDAARDPVAELVRALQLTDEQESQVRALHASMVSRNRPNAVKIETRCQGLCDIIRTKDPDPAQVEAYLLETHEAQDAVQREVVAYLLEVRKCLTDEQAAKLADLVGASVHRNCNYGPCCGAENVSGSPCRGGASVGAR